MTKSLVPLLASARAKYGPGLSADELASIHLREVDGLRQVIRFRGLHWKGQRDSSGVQVLAETRGAWREILK